MGVETVSRKPLVVPRVLAAVLVAAPLVAAGCRDDENVPVDAPQVDAIDAPQVDAPDARVDAPDGPPPDGDGGFPPFD